MNKATEKLIESLKKFNEVQTPKTISYDKIYVALGWYAVTLNSDLTPPGAWLQEHIKGKWHMFNNAYSKTVWVFQDTSDATLFALRWL